MLPSSSSHVARYGQINHYKKFWLLQTQLDQKQEQPSTALSLGVTGSANVKESAKPLNISSNTLLANAGDHLTNNTTAGHGSCRGSDMVSSAPSSSCSSRAGANFPYCSNEPRTSKPYSNGKLGYTHMQSLRRDSSPLSLAVNYDQGVTHPNINFLNHISAHTASCCLPPASELQLHNSPSMVPRMRTSRMPLVKKSSCGEEGESSECSNERGEKNRGQLAVSTGLDNASTSPSTSSFSLSSKQQKHELAHPQGQLSSFTLIPSSLQEAAALLSSSRSSLGCTGTLRICTLCGTSKTPLWRSGPEGPKSLCNACGIRVKKTKRLQAAMEAAGEGAEKIIRSASSPAGAYKRLLAAAAAAAAVTTSKAAGRAGTTHKRKLSMEAAENQSDPFFQLKKKKKKAADRRSSCCSWPPPNAAGVDGGTCYRVFGESPANLAADIATNKKFSTLFAKDVEEAAVLLMALSCGLVLS